jgi:lipid-A-disaccharide synthase-like uncharacterized protein
MTLIRGLIAISRPFSMRLTPCELNGSLIGAIAGLLFCVVWLAGEQANASFVPVAFPLWVQMALLIAAFCWIALVVLLCGPMRHAPSSVVAPLLANAVLTSLLTVYLSNLLGKPLLFVLLGIAVGLPVGRVLCRFCRKPVRVTDRKPKEG